MNLNRVAIGLSPLDLSGTEEALSLQQSATDLGIPFPAYAPCFSRHIVLRGHRFHFLEWGQRESPPLLLLHGGHQSAHSWDLVSLALSDWFHVFALDQRGHGDSEWARDWDYSLGTMAEDVLEFIRILGLDSTIVMAHSMGGLVTMTMLQRAPHIASAIVLVDVGPELSNQGTRRIRSFIEQAQEFDSLESFIDQVQSHDPFRSREHISRTVRYNLLQRVDGRFVSKWDQHIAEGRRLSIRDARPTLSDAHRILRPVLVVRGESSEVLSTDAAERFVEALPRGELITVSDCGHNVHSENTPGFLSAVIPFLARHSAFGGLFVGDDKQPRPDGRPA